MTANAIQLIAASLGMVILTFLVGARLLYTRVQEMRQKRIHPQAAATSVQMSARLENVQAADNFRNLFEVPVLFYALVAVALATNHTPPGLLALLEGMPKASRPRLVRGDCAFGSEGEMSALQAIDQPYLFKLRQSAGVKNLVKRQWTRRDCINVGQIGRAHV